MSLLRTYSKIMLIRNHTNYIRMICSIIMAYVMLSFVTIYFYSLLSPNSVSKNSELRYTFLSVLTILIIAGFMTVIYQLYTVMKSGVKDYKILQGIGATFFDIRVLNIVQCVILFIVSIPIGLLCGYLLTSYLINNMDYLIQNRQVMERITSSSTLFILSGVVFCFIITIGVHLDRNMRKIPLLDNISDPYDIQEVI